MQTICHALNSCQPTRQRTRASRYSVLRTDTDDCKCVLPLSTSQCFLQPLAEGMDGDGVDTITPEAWQADVNNLY